jgi:hypothetical protein
MSRLSHGGGFAPDERVGPRATPPQDEVVDLCRDLIRIDERAADAAQRPIVC